MLEFVCLGSYSGTSSNALKHKQLLGLEQLSIFAVGIVLKVCGTSVLLLFIHAVESLKRVKMRFHSL